jgi:RNA polymerase sigma-70 factor, ECF subfamily
MLDLAAEREVAKPASFADAVREHQSMVFSLAYHVLHDRALAEEVAQDVFLQLHKCFAGFDSADHLKHWLRRVATHRSIDQTRRRKLRAHVSLDDAPPLAAAAVDRDPLLAQMLRRMVASLPANARAVVVLRYQEDLSPVEIAEILNIPVKTVRTRLHRSLAILREKMARGQGGIRS